MAERVLNKSQQRMVNMAAKDKKAKAKGYKNHGDRVHVIKWGTIQLVGCAAVIGYVFFDYIVKWF